MLVKQNNYNPSVSVAIKPDQIFLIISEKKIITSIPYSKLNNLHNLVLRIFFEKMTFCLLF
jgi:hypothetical protein